MPRIGPTAPASRIEVPSRMAVLMIRCRTSAALRRSDPRAEGASNAITGTKRAKSDDQHDGERCQHDGHAEEPDDDGRDREGPQQRPPAGECEAVGPPYADGRVAVDLAEGVGGGGQHQQDARPQQDEGHQRGQDDADAASLAALGDARDVGAPRIRPCSPATTSEAGTVRNPIPMNIRHRDAVHACGGADHLSGGPAPGDAQGRDRRPGGAAEEPDHQHGDQRQDHEQARRVVGELADDVRPAGDSAAEEVGGGGAEERRRPVRRSWCRGPCPPGS